MVGPRQVEAEQVQYADDNVKPSRHAQVQGVIRRQKEQQDDPSGKAIPGGGKVRRLASSQSVERETPGFRSER